MSNQMDMDQLLAVFMPHLLLIKGLEVAVHDRERVCSWLAATYTACGEDVERTVSHIERLRFLGASEVVVAVAERNGQIDKAATMRDIIAQKLLRVNASAPRADQEIDGLLAQEMRARFHRKYASLGCQTDRRALGLIVSSRKGITRSWMWGCPADIVVLDGKTYTVGYHAQLGASADIEARWILQEHQYRRVALDHGIPVEGMLLAKMYVRDDGRLDMGVFEVPFDQDKEAALIEAGDYFWAYRDRDELPPAPALRELAELPPVVLAAAKELAAFDGFAERAVANSNRLKAEIQASMASVEFNGSVVIGPVMVTRHAELDVARATQILGGLAESAKKTKPSAERMAAWITAKGEDLSQFMVPDGYDTEALTALLKQKGLAEGLLMDGGQRITVRLLDDCEVLVAAKAKQELLDVATQDAMSEMQQPRVSTSAFVAPA